MIGERYVGEPWRGRFRCRGICQDGKQCARVGTNRVSFYVLCKSHKEHVTKQRRPLNCVECPDTINFMRG